ncbi:MAG: DUF1343 domain-containing protein [Candidatus Omnitrophica bacterium]|nr:DUF1343 domain-containing protein [Candidatus Omnitrophota bacterium]
MFSLRSSLLRLQGLTVGLITNHTGRSLDGTSTIDLFHRTRVCRLKALFSPEHGIQGLADEKVHSGTDAHTGLKVFSLYGDLRKPTPDMLKGLDALVLTSRISGLASTPTSAHFHCACRLHGKMIYRS